MHDEFDQLLAHPFEVCTGRILLVTSDTLRTTLEQALRSGRRPTHFAESGSLCLVVSPEQSQALLEAGAAPHAEVQMIRFRPESGDRLYSQRCRSCPGWIHSLGGDETDRRGICLCGQAFRITFDLPESRISEQVAGIRCATCGLSVTLTSPGQSSWFRLNPHQMSCTICTRAFEER
jgi:hypothetical protein